MPKEASTDLHKLIKSLNKSEKRYFKLHVGERDQASYKFVQLFDAIDKQAVYDEQIILEENPKLSENQLSNLKAHLYKKMLQALRQFHHQSVKEIEIREMIDYVLLLYNRSLFKQCKSMLTRAKKWAEQIDNLELQLEIFKWEKRIATQVIEKNNMARVNTIITNTRQVTRSINNINRFSNLSSRLNSMYLKMGFIRDEEDYNQITDLFHQEIPDYDEEKLSFLEKLHLYELLVGYHNMLQDFQNGYYYASRWVEMFERNTQLIPGKVSMYIQAINNLMIAQYKLMKYDEFVKTKRKLKMVRNIKGLVINENIRQRLLKYTFVHEFNRIFMLGEFGHGVALMERIKPQLGAFISQIDSQSRLILYYKIACLYTGNSDWQEAIKWLNKIINIEDPDIREDIHCFARIINLVCHYEMGNMDVIEYYLRSAFRFLLKKDDLHNYQRYLLGFMRHLNKGLGEKELTSRFETLRDKLQPLENNPYEKRSFIYFDIISWLESKIYNRPVEEIIKEKAYVILSRGSYLSEEKVLKM